MAGRDLLRRSAARPDRDQPHPTVAVDARCRTSNTARNLHREKNTGDYELGGSARSANNLWPEPYQARAGARVTGQIENKLHNLVCTDAINLHTAQRAISGDWWRAYQHYIVH